MSGTSEPSAVSVEVDVEHRFVRQIYRGPLTAARIREVWQELASDPRGPLAFDTLVDLSAARVRLSSDEVWQLARAAARMPESRRAIVAPSDHDYGMMRMLELVAEDSPFHYGVFRCVAEACAWLRNPGCVASGP